MAVTRRTFLGGCVAVVLATVFLVAASSVAARTGAASTDHRPDLSSAERFLVTELDQKLRGRWALAWRELYPLHQKVAPRALYVRCEQQTSFPAPLQGLEVERVARVPVHIPGVAAPEMGAAITVRVALEWYGPRDPIVFRHVFHLVPVGRRWTWLLSAGEFRSYRSGGCMA